MATAFDQFDQYASIAFEGQIHDLSMADLETFVAEGGDIPFGRAIAQGTAPKSGILAAEAGLILGITVMSPVAVGGGFLSGADASTGNPVGAHREGKESTVMSFGRIWVKTLGGAVRGQQVYIVPETGELTNAAAGNLVYTNARFRTDAAAGGLAIVQVQGVVAATAAA